MRPIPLTLALAAAALGLAAGPLAAQDATTTTEPPEAPASPGAAASPEAPTAADAPDATAPEAPTADASEAAAPDAELREAAQRLVEGEATQTMMDEMLSPDLLLEAMQAQFGDQMDEEMASRIAEIASEELGEVRPAMQEAMIDAAVETFTLEEIEAQVAFQETPEGRSVMTKMQPYMTSFYGKVGPEFQAAQTRMMERLEETMPQQ